MAFSSLAFLLFFALTAVLYYLVPRRLQWVALLAANCVFYAFAGLRPALFLIFTILSTYAAACLIDQISGKYDALRGQAEGKKEKSRLRQRAKGRKRLVLALCLLLNFGILAFIKYSVFLAGVLPGVSPLGLALPLGMSFYMFISMGYLIDVYRGKYPAERNPARFALFVSFFPQIIQGPLARYDRLAPQLFAGGTWDTQRGKHGVLLMLWGFFKKLVIADRAAVLVGSVFGSSSEYGGSILFLSIVFYSVQIYCDFSGGIDIARGAAQVLGVELDENFRQPFFAVSVADFWRRWHISLGTWLRDYLFYPISISGAMARLGRRTRKLLGNAYGRLIPTSVATFLVYIVVGVWHGGSLKYLAFGFYNGIIITSSLFLAAAYDRARARLRLRDDGRGLHIFRVLRTLLLVFIGRYFTRSPSLGAALSLLGRTFRHPIPSQLWDGTVMRLGLGPWDFLILFVGVVLLIFYDIRRERDAGVIEALDRRHAAIQYGVLAVILLGIIFFGIYSGGYQASEFIYAQF